MTEVIAFPSAEAVTVGYLRARLGERSITARVGTKIPSPRPAQLVKVRRIGGPAINIVTDGPTLVFECWGATETDAEDLAKVVRAEVDAMPDQEPLCNGVDEIGGPVNQPDPDSNYPRYVFTATVYLRGQAI